MSQSEWRGAGRRGIGLLPDVLEGGADEHLGLEVGDNLAEVVDQAEGVVANYVQYGLQDE